MVEESQLHLFSGDTLAIIGDPHLLHTAASDFHDYVGSTRVDGVLHQFFNHRRRSLDYLTRGDLGSQFWRKYFDRHDSI
jgi:hypothetical protein